MNAFDIIVHPWVGLGYVFDDVPFVGQQDDHALLIRSFFGAYTFATASSLVASPPIPTPYRLGRGSIHPYAIPAGTFNIVFNYTWDTGGIISLTTGRPGWFSRTSEMFFRAFAVTMQATGPAGKVFSCFNDEGLIRQGVKPNAGTVEQNMAATSCIHG